MSKHKKKNRNKRKQQPPDSGASSHNMPQSPMATSEQQAAMSLEAFRQPLQSLPQQQHYGAEGSTPHLPFEQPSKQSVSVQQQPAILDPPCDLNSLIKLASDLYYSTIGVLPTQHRPDHGSILKTLTSWAHLCAPSGSGLSVRDQMIAQLQEEMVIGKVADVVYVLVEINKHRYKQRNQQTQELLKRAVSVLEMPVIVRKLTAMNNPYLTDAKFDRATPGMRFHIYSQILETYVGVLGIGAAFWGIKKMQLELAMEENGAVKDYSVFGYLEV